MRAPGKALLITSSSLMLTACVGLPWSLPVTDRLPLQAEFDIPLVEKAVRMVKSKFDKDGRPPHWQPAASETALGESSSSIFVVDHHRLLKMSPMEIREVHRHRHILVTGVEGGAQIVFDANGLQMLADLDQEVSVQRTLCP